MGGEASSNLKILIGPISEGQFLLASGASILIGRDMTAVLTFTVKQFRAITRKGQPEPVPWAPVRRGIQNALKIKKFIKCSQ